MAVHRVIQRLLLVGAKLDTTSPPPIPPPPALAPLIDAITTAHRTFDERAIQFGHRYRSGYWAIYVLSAIAAMLHRVHSLNTWLFGLTGVCAFMHLAVHTLWLSLFTTFFPALGASLHGALAPSEAYRLSVRSERLVGELQGAITEIRAVLTAQKPADGADFSDIKVAIQSAIALIVEEHQDWHMLMRPHRLPLG